MSSFKPVRLAQARAAAQTVVMLLGSSLVVAAFLSGLEGSLGAGL